MPSSHRSKVEANFPDEESVSKWKQIVLHSFRKFCFTHKSQRFCVSRIFKRFGFVILLRILEQTMNCQNVSSRVFYLFIYFFAGGEALRVSCLHNARNSDGPKSWLGVINYLALHSWWKWSWCETTLRVGVKKAQAVRYRQLVSFQTARDKLASFVLYLLRPTTNRNTRGWKDSSSQNLTKRPFYWRQHNNHVRLKSTRMRRN